MGMERIRHRQDFRRCWGVSGVIGALFGAGGGWLSLDSTSARCGGAPTSIWRRGAAVCRSSSNPEVMTMVAGAVLLSQCHPSIRQPVRPGSNRPSAAL